MENRHYGEHTLYCGVTLPCLHYNLQIQSQWNYTFNKANIQAVCVSILYINTKGNGSITTLVPHSMGLFLQQ